MVQSFESATESSAHRPCAEQGLIVKRVNCFRAERGETTLNADAGADRRSKNLTLLTNLTLRPIGWARKASLRRWIEP